MARLKRVLWHLLAGTRGGPLRVCILALMRDMPLNTNQLAVALGIDYKTAQHHLRVLCENRVLSRTGDGYGAVYLMTPEMEDSLDEFDVIAQKLAPRIQAARERRAAQGKETQAWQP